VNHTFKTIVGLLFLHTLGCNSQGNAELKMEKLINRKPVVSGRFYPAQPDQLKSDLKKYFDGNSKKQFAGTIQALIVPHAGYVFSGDVAASAYLQLNPEQPYKNIFILAPSHHYPVQGASVYNLGNYVTPLGEVEVNREIANQLMTTNPMFKYVPEADKQEHSLEVQLPFLQYYLKKPFKLVPIIIGTDHEPVLKSLAESLQPYFNPDNIFIISSDFSHYPNYQKAQSVDTATMEAIVSNEIQKVKETLIENKNLAIPNLATSACGISGILTLMYLTQNNTGIHFEPIKYNNSGDSPYGDHQRVVGYWSIIAVAGKPKPIFELTADEKQYLLVLARQTINEYLIKHKTKEPHSVPQNLTNHTGAFVTLHLDGKLKGCIGRFEADEPLYKVVQKMAIAAATSDSRFEPLKLEELKHAEIEISVLTPLQKIKCKEDIVIGTHGIYIQKGLSHGTLLPQVASDNHWTVDEFLGYCSRNKAGLGWEGWKDADLFTYTAIVFSEKERP